MRPLAFAAGFALIGALAVPSLAFRQAENPAKMLANRTAGPPRECILRSQVDRTKLFNSGDVLFEMKSGPWYLNHPDPCPNLRSDRVLIERSPSSNICRGDTFEVHDRVAPTGYGRCAYSDFIPYTKTK